MLLTELVEALVAHMNANKAKWTTEDITVKAELDGMPDPSSALTVFVMPQAMQPIIGSSRTRGRRNQNIQLLIVTLVISKEFNELPETDTVGIANWTTEVVPIINTMQRSIEVLLTYENSTLTLEEVEPSPPEPITQDLRTYAVMTTFSFQQVVCDTAHEL